MRIILFIVLLTLISIFKVEASSEDFEDLFATETLERRTVENRFFEILNYENSDKALYEVTITPPEGVNLKNLPSGCLIGFKKARSDDNSCTLIWSFNDRRCGGDKLFSFTIKRKESSS
ncbi:hypothetical protein [Candidatus Nucleicultrix amoebiphila]|jgi:hypothetical protein|uniref:Uncharacterized protein n=1 Tax=Candidatus Nucleicultrix amoebiphila FS5 TaxID=1414854 RepID=A0A1W6N3S7_9PROT|nr:hypothetical protein [Candidatus Nucleicultrix amoebiphila]ARN84540.1 hypothetical protein GQ61_03500 [Candidatus Nucleicultrix amoebiphila FS5]